MISVLLLVQFSVCNAQWPVQSIGYEEIRQPPRPSDQPGYPYDDVHLWPGMSQNPDLKLPETESKNTKTLLKPVDSLELHIVKNGSRNVISNDPESVWDRVTEMVHQQSALRNKTDEFMDHINYLYLNLATDESDNAVAVENSYKYGMSVILRFLLEFYRIFRKLSSHPSAVSRIDVYRASYDKAVDVMKTKRHYSPLQISVPIRRSVDIFKSIIYQSVMIVQAKCEALSPNWRCVLLYFANLVSESINCPNIWHHALVHMMALENKMGIPDIFIYKIVDLHRFEELRYFENIFDFVVEKLEEYREVGRIQLSAEAVIFTMLADLQENGLLDCISIDYLYN